jgi:DNA-binding NarL/FixJ family response regulator
MKIVLYSDDVNLLSYWEKSLGEPSVIVENIEELHTINEALVILNYTACKSECRAVVTQLNAQQNRVLVLDRTPFFERAQEMLHLGAYGYGNAIMHAHFIVAAVNTIREKMVWLYPEFISQLIFGISPSEGVSDSKLSILSQREKDVALLLKEGLTYKEIAEKLNITPRTIKAHAQNIYAKLQVKDRLALALLLR